jgi:hypothetical protein
MATERFDPAGSWHALDSRRPPHTRLHKGPTRREIDNLTRANAQDGVYTGVDEEGEMGKGTQAPIGHQHIIRC